jgi:hypothetical protein
VKESSVPWLNSNCVLAEEAGKVRLYEGSLGKVLFLSGKESITGREKLGIHRGSLELLENILAQENKGDE